jgi:hypothetical protein
MTPELRAQLLAELEAERVAAEAGKIQIEEIRPGMSEESWKKAAQDVLDALKEAN